MTQHFHLSNPYRALAMEFEDGKSSRRDDITSIQALTNATEVKINSDEIKNKVNTTPVDELED